MIRFIAGVFATATLLVFSYIWGPTLLNRLLARGDATEWHDIPKQPTYRQMGRIYTTDMDGCGVRLEPFGVDVNGLVAGGRKVFTTKGDAA